MTDAADTSPARAGRSRTFRVGTVAAALTLLVAGVVAVILASRSAVDGVIVFQDAEPLLCDGAEVFPYTDEWDDSEAALPSVVFAPGLECAVRVHVRNDGWADARIDAVRLAMMGPSASLGLHPVSVSPNGDRPRAVDDIDMLVPLTEVVVPAGGSMRLEARFRYDGHAKMDECTSVSWVPASVELSAFGSSTRAAPQLPVRFAQGDPRDCGAPSE